MAHAGKASTGLLLGMLGAAVVVALLVWWLLRRLHRQLRGSVAAERDAR